MRSWGAPVHPIADQFFNTRKSLGQILAAYTRAKCPVVRAMCGLREAMAGGEAAGALAAAAAVANEKVEPGLYLLFLGMWQDAARSSGREQEAAFAFRRARQIVPKSAPTELRALLLMQEAIQANVVGNIRRMVECLDRALGLLGTEHPFRWRVTRSAVGIRCQLGRGAEAANDLVRLEREAGDGIDFWIGSSRLENWIETGEVERAAELLASISGQGEWPAFLKERVPLWQDKIALYRGEYSPPEGNSGFAGELGCAISTWELLQGRSEKALEWARADHANVVNVHVRLGMHSCVLVRAELACGNPRAAMRLLEMRQARGAEHYVDDLFRARALWSMGERGVAARLFSRAVKVCERYGAGRRLDFELRLAPELSPGDLVRMARAAGDGPRAGQNTAVARDRAPTGNGGEALGVDRLLGRSPGIAAVRDLIRRMAPLNVPVLIGGETGTGKELAARALHEESHRRGKPFIAVNCGAITESLLESELFGHERGAFSGAARTRRGFFEEAAAGTIFLDEIGEMSPRLQVALLRVLEAGEVRRVGASHGRKINCRVLAASNLPLTKLAVEGHFRKDLLYRLRRLEVRIPPLRDRQGDAALLAEHFLAEGRGAAERPVLSSELRDEISARDWPGNVRELRNAIERMRLLNSDKLHYDSEDLESRAPVVAEARSAAEAGRSQPVGSGTSPMRRVERVRDLFRRRRKLTRLELINALGVSPDTMTKYLKVLIAEGAIEKVCPTASPRTHYFQIAE